MELMSDVERAERHKADTVYRLLGWLGGFFLAAGCLLVFYYVESLPRLGSPGFIEVVVIVLPPLAIGGACLACRRLHARLKRVERWELEARVERLEKRLIGISGCDDASTAYNTP